MAFLDGFPYVVARARDVEVARRTLGRYDEAVAGRQTGLHPVADRFLQQGRLRDQWVAFCETGHMQDGLSAALAEYEFVRLDEMPIEGEHRL
eukprot:2830119-Alexandrium_andersonii.AAC.1